MKTNHLTLIATMGLFLSLSAQANDLIKSLEIKLPQVIQIGNRTVRIPGSIAVIKTLDGRYTTDKSDFNPLGGHKVGNGGDYIRSTFIQVGENVTEYLQSTEAGSEIVSRHGLNLAELKSTLTTERIVLSNEPLIDNTGSVVDAIGVPGLIILNSANWLDHFEKERNVYYLVLHEMLRSSAVDDDDFIISKDIMNFPSQFKMSTRLLPLIPMLESDSIAELVTLDKISVNGTGCSAKAPAYTELDLTKNVIDITLKNFTATNSEARKVDYKSCNMAVPLKLPAGKRLTISLVDVSGEVRPQAESLKSTSTLKFEAFLAGSQGKVQQKVVTLESESRTVLFRKTDVMTTGCGTSEILRLNVNNALVSKGSATAGLINQSQVKKISVYLNLEDCTQ